MINLKQCLVVDIDLVGCRSVSPHGPIMLKVTFLQGPLDRPHLDPIILIQNNLYLVVFVSAECKDHNNQLNRLLTNHLHYS